MYPKTERDVFVGFLGLSWQEKVISNLKKSYPEYGDKWKGIFSRVYDAYLPLVKAGNKPFAGPGDTVTAAKIAAITGDTATDIIRTLSAVAYIDNEKITLQHKGIFEKLTSAPGEAVKNALKPLVPFLIPIVGLAAIGAYFYFVDLKKAQYRALVRQKI